MRSLKWVCLLVFGLVALACGTRDAETRAETRGSIAGQVVLADVAGLDDLSRVRVDIGAGEGGVQPDEDGSFLFADIEADLYALTITYQGGLASDASDSGYQPYSVNVPIATGNAVNLGRVALERGMGTVRGSLTGWEGAATSVKLRSDSIVREAPVIDGEYLFEDVPVGGYDLKIVADGSGESGCGGAVLVAFHGAEVTADLPVSGTPSLTPGPDEVTDTSGGEWRLSGDGVSVNVDRHLPMVRAWRSGTAPDYSEYDPGEAPSFAFSDLAEGNTTVNIQWVDVCGVESEPVALTLVRDLTPPTVSITFTTGIHVSSCELANGTTLQGPAQTPGTISNAVPLTLAAQDDETPDRSRLTTKIVVCDVTQDSAVCDPPLSEVAPSPYEQLTNVAFGEHAGLKEVRAVAVDPSGNESEVARARICFDPAGPDNISLEVLEIGEGGIIRTPAPTVRLLATGATLMRVGTTPGLADAIIQPYDDEFTFQFPPGDGEKTLYVRLGDEIGNWTEEYSVSVVLDTSASISGHARLGGADSHGGIAIALVGTSYTTTTDDAGAFTISDVFAAANGTRYQLHASHDGYLTQVVSLDLIPNQDLELVEPVRLPELDDTPPQDMQVVIEDGGVLRQPSAWVYVSGTGATQMKVGSTSGLAGVSWQPYVDSFVWDFTPSDGIKRLYLRFRDDAGNETGEIVAEAELNTRGRVSGTVVLFGESDHGGAQVALLGTAHATTTNAAGRWAIEDVPGGTYNLEITKANFRTHRENSFYVAAAQDNDVGRVVLEAFRAQVIGQVDLEGWTGTLNHANAHATLPHPTEPGVVFEDFTDAAGNFTLYVEPTNYPERLTIAKAGYTTYEHPTTFAVGPDDTFNIGLVRLSASANDLSGRIRLAGHNDHSNTTVTVAGINGEVTEGELFETTTDVAGDYLFELLPLGPYRVRYAYEAEPHRETYAVEIEIGAGIPTQLETVTLRDRYLVIAEGAEATADPVVSVALGASDCLEQRVTNTVADFADPDWGWGECEAALDWDLGRGDGEKHVYAQFKVQSDPANPTDTVSDSITLDTESTIVSFVHDGEGRILGSGAILRLTLAGETGARVWAVIENYDDNVVLYDDGTRGDDLANDGLYQRDYVINRVDDVDAARVTGYLQDALGNSGSLDATGTVTVHVPPLITNVVVLPNILAGTVAVSWDTDEPTSGIVHWGIDESYGSDEADVAIATSHSVTFGAGVLEPGVTYHFSIEAIDEGSNASATNDGTFELVPSRPVYVVAIPGINRNHVRWEASSMAPLRGYNIYRAITPGGPYTQLNGEPCGDHSSESACNAEAWVYEDTSAVAGTTYYYVVVAVDPSNNEGLYSEETSATPAAANMGPTELASAIDADTGLGEAGTPYIVTTNVAVATGRTLAVGPGTELRFDSGYRLVVEGRLAVLGERGTLASDGEGGTTESDDGLVVLRSNQDTGAPGDWRGVYFDPVSPRGLLDVNAGRYFGGNVFYRGAVMDAGQSGVRMEEGDLAFLRSIAANNEARGACNYATGGGLMFAGGDLLVQHARFEGNAVIDTNS